MPGEKTKKKSSKDKIDKVRELVRQGYNDSKIAREVGIHRTTVKRYRELVEKRAIGTEARIRVVQESLWRHFDDLGQTCTQLQNTLTIAAIRELEKIVVKDLQTSQMLPISLSGRLGNEAKLILKVGKGRAEIDHLLIEEELLFTGLLNHTKNLDLWDFFREWKEKAGQYISNLSGFYSLLNQEVTARTGLATRDSDDKTGLTPDFVRTIFIDVGNYALLGHETFEGVPYATTYPGNNMRGLQLNGYLLASASDSKPLKKWQEIHSQFRDYYRNPSNQPQEFRTSFDIRLRLQKLESEIFLELQKLILKRNFLGRCDLCPD